jgi:uncharacterized protein DUF6916
VSEQLTYAGFTNNLQTKFHLKVGSDQNVELELTEVSELKLSPGQEQFAIVFRGPSETFLGQGTRSLSHERMGEFDLFLVPIKQDSQGFYYEAVFNRLRHEKVQSADFVRDEK